MYEKPRDDRREWSSFMLFWRLALVWRTAGTPPPAAAVWLLLRLCLYYVGNSEKLMWLEGTWQVILGVQCLFCGSELAGAAKEGLCSMQRSGFSKYREVYEWGCVLVWCRLARRCSSCFRTTSRFQTNIWHTVCLAGDISSSSEHSKPLTGSEFINRHRPRSRDGHAASVFRNWQCWYEETHKDTNLERAKRLRTVWKIGTDVCEERGDEHLVEMFENKARA